MTLEEQLIALMEEHQLTALSINLGSYSDGKSFSSYVHAGTLCESGIHSTSISEALGNSIALINAKRGDGLSVGELAPINDPARDAGLILIGSSVNG